MAITVLALDLERTLISDAYRAEPRPGLYAFLSFCLERFARVVLFTTVETQDARAVLEHLSDQGHIPPQFLERVEFVAWSGEYKALEFVGADPETILLVDDDGSWIRPDQREQWVALAPWDGGEDAELERVREIIVGKRSPFMRSRKIRDLEVESTAI
jgi:hypothetical protein